MANWQSINELQDIASDLPRFTHALDELSRRLGLDITPLTGRSHFFALPSKRHC
ncbi:Protein yecM [Escherichia coli]|uniref:Protein yecM n=1 Tax=Escherichia coli TaxID=562 RepID=A0A376VJ21_ECOLX|nr:Protein yecM [Escherichia coli]